MRLTFSDLAKIVGEEFLVVNGFKSAEKAYIRTTYPDKPATFVQCHKIECKAKAPEVSKDLLMGEQEIEIQKRNEKGKKVGKKKKVMMSYQKKIELKDIPKQPFIRLLCRLHNKGLNVIYAVDFIFEFKSDDSNKKGMIPTLQQALGQGPLPLPEEEKFLGNRLFCNVQAFKEYELEGITWREWKDSVIENKKKIEFLNSL
jgi:hypothetical protein